MTRQELNDFIHSAERSASLRRSLQKCRTSRELIKIAADYGFSIGIEDLENESIASNTEEWFKTSKISPIPSLNID